MAAAPATAGAVGPAKEAAPEQTVFNVILADMGANKISVIKTVREIVPTLGLQEAKTLVESAPKELLNGVNKKTAEEAKGKLEKAGAKVELK
jgi:large subunit ribosomal protein L7/L12